jgi:uncharacterized lipoprotein
MKKHICFILVFIIVLLGLSACSSSNKYVTDDRDKNNTGATNSTVPESDNNSQNLKIISAKDFSDGVVCVCKVMH